ncbi:MAG: hypothetical protein J07HN6_00239 [Halonotius sp. J07HN6]|nr:MAG: hypothetical protein J07HN6_00239 [Halonotius sp. J07HN6]
MPSTDSDTELDPETESAIRRVVRDERSHRDATGLRGAVRAITQIGGGLFVGWLGFSVAGGGLIATDAPPVLAIALVAVGFLLLIAYGWQLPPFR